MDEKTIKAAVCIAENGLIYTGQAAQAIQDCWNAKDLSDKIENIKEFYSCF